MMGALSPILRSADGGRVMFWCPGCECAHAVRVEGEGRPCWAYNGNPETPTFTPSLLVTYNGSDAGVDDAPPAVCHSYVTDGQIQFLPDSTHSLGGQTVPLPPWEEA